MNAGDEIRIKATVLRVDDERVDAQTPDGQLIQTKVGNTEVFQEVKTPLVVAGGAIEHDAKEASRGKRKAAGN